MYHKQYPIGKFEKPAVISPDVVADWISIIAAFPENITMEVANLSDRQLDTPYREGGWTLRQVVHHCADSHINAFCRIKLAITEDAPVIKPYFEDRWAELADSKAVPIEASLAILKGLHQRWAVLLSSLHDDDLDRIFVHPEHSRKIGLSEAIGMYAWHCRHHLAHITALKTSENWT